MNQYFQQLSRSVCRLSCILLLVIQPLALAETFLVGPSAGQPESSCQFNSLQQAIDALPDDDEQHVINLEQASYFGDKGTIDVDGRTITVKTLFVSGSGCTRVQTDQIARLRASNTGLPGGRTVVVRNDGNLTLERVAVEGNQRGGLLVRDSTLVLKSSVVADNSTQAGASGAGIVIEGGAVALEDSRLIGNVAGANGGAIFCTRSAGETAGVMVGRGSVFEQNSALNGGAVFQFRGCRVVVEEDAEFVDNSSTVDGGAIATERTASGAVERNTLSLDGDAVFNDNQAGRDGGAISLAGQSAISASPGGIPRVSFFDNTAGRFGGAIDIANSGAEADVDNARFLFNSARERGGAVSVRGGRAVFRSSCARGATIEENYCAVFGRNQVANESNLTRRGGTLSLDSGELSVDGYAFRDSLGPAAVNGESGGVIASIISGFMKISNSLVYDNTEGLGSNTQLFLLRGGRTQFSFNTMVGTPDGSVILVQPSASAEFVGNIIAENNVGVVRNGPISGTCNNIQLGAGSAPDDPGFVTTSAGRFRLSPDSPMINLAQSCRDSALPAGYEFPSRDLDGVVRRGPDEAERDLDIGAFEFRLDDPGIFRSGFEFESPPVIEKDALFGPGY